MLVVVGVAAFIAIASVHAFLAPMRLAQGPDGTGARTLVVEGWLDPPELDQVMSVFAAGHYDRVLTTGGPINVFDDSGGWKNYAVRSADYLRAHGLSKVSVIAVPTPDSLQERTYLSALMLRDWARRSSVELRAVDLFTADVHARRSRTVYGMALGRDVEIGIIAARPTEYDGATWWASSAGAKSTIGELISVAWTTCCFWPSAAAYGASPAGAPASAAPQ